MSLLTIYYPIAAMIVLLAWATLSPMPRPTGAFDFGALLSVYFRAAVFVSGTLVAWLIWATFR